MANGQKEDVNHVLDDVIVKINRITDHLRESGESEAASRFTQEMTNTLSELYDIIAPWDIEKCLMRCHETSISATQFPISDSQASDLSNCPPTPSPNTTWAAIAATEPVTEKNGIIKFRPSDSLQTKICHENDKVRITPQEYTNQRVVWIRPWTPDRRLEEISRKLSNIGAIYSMAYSPEAGAVCVIFQYAQFATEFMERCTRYTDLLGAEYEIAPGLPYPVTKDLLRMEAPSMERRRLTFARQGLFQKDGVTQRRFRSDIEEIVGETNLELLWLFNTGNATVVFSAVPLARLVRETFYRYGRDKKSPYNGIMVSYSHDPCERDMHLVSQIPGHPGYLGAGNPPASGSRPRAGTFGSTTSNGSYSVASHSHSATFKRRMTSSHGSKPSIDENGWQTVKKRR